MENRITCYTKKHHVAFEVDEEDLPLVLAHTWFCDRKGYICTSIKRKGAKLHRLIMNTPMGMETDHIDGNPQNNCRSNLRSCTRSQNQHNQRPRLTGTSTYKGVSWFERGSKWRVTIRINGKGKHVGYFDNEKEAAIAYDIKAIELFGEFAQLNII